MVFIYFFSYPAPLMIKIAELSKDIAKKYREIKKTKLQRTFVTASNAAVSKIGNIKFCLMFAV